MMINDSNAVCRHYRLSDWTFVLSLPTSVRDFTRAKAYGEFCVGLSFDKYRADLLDAFEEHVAPLTRFGLRIVRYATVRQYSKLLSDANPTVLYTHSDGSRLEFRDGLIPFEQIVGLIKPGFAGIAEICACEAVGLQDLMKSRAPGSLVKVSHSILRSDFWMIYYGCFFRAFEPGPVSFGEAVRESTALLGNLQRQAVANRSALAPPAEIRLRSPKAVERINGGGG